MIRALTIAALCFAAPASAHDQWANGAPIPDWIKSSCCGPADAHHLTPAQVHRTEDGFYIVDGYKGQISPDKALPSQDGEYWVFYSEEQNEGPEGSKSTEQSNVYCFFVPMEF